MKSTVETDATKIMLYASEWIAPSPVAAQTITAAAATNSSAIMPPRPTKTLGQRLRKLHDEVVST